MSNTGEWGRRSWLIVTQAHSCLAANTNSTRTSNCMKFKKVKNFLRAGNGEEETRWPGQAMRPIMMGEGVETSRLHQTSWRNFIFGFWREDLFAQGSHRSKNAGILWNNFTNGRGGSTGFHISYSEIVIIPKFVENLNKDFIKAVRGGGVTILWKYFIKFRYILKDGFPKLQKPNKNGGWYKIAWVWRQGDCACSPKPASKVAECELFKERGGGQAADDIGRFCCCLSIMMIRSLDEESQQGSQKS